jgi:cysteine desulfurase
MIDMNLDALPLMRPGVADALARSLENPVLATARHRNGLQAAERLEASRAMVGEFLGAEPSEIVFVSSASEANTWALSGARFSGGRPPDHILVSPLEHVSILKTAVNLQEQKKVSLTLLRLCSDGSVDLDWLRTHWPSGRVLVSVQRANPETGTLQPIDEIGALVRERGGVFHSDFVAVEGWEAPELDERPVDLVTISSTAIGGPSGIASLWIRRGVRMLPLIHGGAQEEGRRGGTQPVFLSEGFGAAAHHAGIHGAVERQRIFDLDSLLQKKIMEEFPDVTLVGGASPRRAGILNLLVPGIDGQALLSLMDSEGVIVGTGSSCSSQSLKVSHVLTALGYSARAAQGSSVLSLGWWNQPSDISPWANAFRKGIQTLSKLKSTGTDPRP